MPGLIKHVGFLIVWFLCGPAACSGFSFVLLALATVLRLFPVHVVTVTVHVVFRKTKHFKRRNQELQFALHVALDFDVVDLMLKEVLGRLAQLKAVEPIGKIVLFNILPGVGLLLLFLFLVRLLIFFLIVGRVVLLLLVFVHFHDFRIDHFNLGSNKLLKGNALRNDVAQHGLLLQLKLGFDLLVVLFALHLGYDKFATFADSVHVLRLQKVVKRVEFEALVQQLDIHIKGQTHKSDSLVLDLGN